MSASFCTQTRFYPPSLPPPEEQQPDHPETGWARRVPLRPARYAFLPTDELGPTTQDGKDPASIDSSRPVRHLRTWRGRVLAPPAEDLVPVVLSEVPSGRTVETSLESAAFVIAKVEAVPDAPFVFRWWWEWDGSRWERREEVRAP